MQMSEAQTSSSDSGRDDGKEGRADQEVVIKGGRDCQIIFDSQPQFSSVTRTRVKINWLALTLIA